MADVTMLQHALGYAAADVPVIPLRGKHPRTAHAKDDATDDPKVITEWWTRWPDANIGVRPPAGIVVLDVDPRNGGDGELHRLQVEHGLLPRTLTCRTGSGGLHIWLAYLGATRGKLGAGIDVKTNSGYLVAPPSVHPDTGRPYRWVDQSPTASAPAWVRRLLSPPAVRRRPVGAASGSLAGLLRVVLDATDGELNNRLYWACCRACEDGLDNAELVDAAVAKGHPRRGAENTALSASRRTS